MTVDEPRTWLSFNRPVETITIFIRWLLLAHEAYCKGQNVTKNQHALVEATKKPTSRIVRRSWGQNIFFGSLHMFREALWSE